MNTMCPHCQLVIDCSGTVGGQLLQCPRCSSGFVSPEALPMIRSSRGVSPARRQRSNTPILIVGGLIAGVVVVAGLIVGSSEFMIWNVKRHIGNELKQVGEKMSENVAKKGLKDADDLDKQADAIIASAKAEKRELTFDESDRIASLRDATKELREIVAKLQKKP